MSLYAYRQSGDVMLPPPPLPWWAWFVARAPRRWAWVRRACGGHWETRGGHDYMTLAGRFDNWWRKEWIQFSRCTPAVEFDRQYPTSPGLMIKCEHSPLRIVHRDAIAVEFPFDESRRPRLYQSLNRGANLISMRRVVWLLLFSAFVLMGEIVIRAYFR